MKIIQGLLAGMALLPAMATGAIIDDLEWMAGDWRGTGENEFVQEVWLKPVNGFMNGISRMFAGDELVMHEHLFIATEGDELVYRLEKHLRNESGEVKARKPIVMRVIEAAENRALFENIAPSPDEPRQLEYRRDGERMIITVTGPPGAVTDQLGDDGHAGLVFELVLASSDRHSG